MYNLKKERLIIFVKKPEMGKVKTRLAKTIGEKSSLEVYKKLLIYTFKQISKLHMDIALYLSKPTEDIFFTKYLDCKIHVQLGKDLGERMYNAFSDTFKQGYQLVGIIGSDCPEISVQILNEAFIQLKKKDIVIGPARDGGYYFLGMQKLYKEIFQKKSWGTEKLLQQTIEDCKNQSISFHLLKTLSDIDNKEDLKKFPQFSSMKKIKE